MRLRGSLEDFSIAGSYFRNVHGDWLENSDGRFMNFARSIRPDDLQWENIDVSLAKIDFSKFLRNEMISLVIIITITTNNSVQDNYHSSIELLNTLFIIIRNFIESLQTFDQ